MSKDKFIKDILPLILIVLFSLVMSIITNDYFPGGVVLLLGFTAFFYQIRGKWFYNFFSIVYTFCYAFISVMAGLYAYIFFAVIVYIPCYIYGLFSWKKKTTDGRVETKAFSLKNTIILFFGIVAGGFGLGALISLIPGQNMAYLDSVIQLFNVSAVILCSFRHRECWYAWIIQNVMTLGLWSFNLQGGATSAAMVLIINLVYFVGNFRGIYSWNKAARKYKADANNLDKKEELKIKEG